MVAFRDLLPWGLRIDFSTGEVVAEVVAEVVVEVAVVGGEEGREVTPKWWFL